MDKLRKDEIILLALELDSQSLLNLCRTSSRINSYICGSEIFWKNKIEKERPGFLEHMVGKLKPIKYRDLYVKLQGNDVYEIEQINLTNERNYYIKGDFDSHDFKEYIDVQRLGEFWSENKTSVKNWQLWSDHPEYTFEDLFTNTRVEAIKIAEKEINFQLQDEENEIINRYLKKLEEYDIVSIDEENSEFTLNIEPIDIL